MYIHNCPECGKQYSTQEKVNRVKCPYCGAETNVSYADQDQQTANQQWRQYASQAGDALDSVFNNGPSGKSRGVAGLLALLMGALGLHYFYLGKSTAIVFLIIFFLSCGILGVVTQVISVIQAVLFFTSSQQEFEQKWVYCPSNFPLF